MRTLPRFLEALAGLWRVIVVVVACFSFYEYENHRPSLLNGDDVATIVESARQKTNLGFFAAAFDRAERFIGFGQSSRVGSAVQAGGGTPGPDLTAKQGAAGSAVTTGSQRAATSPTTAAPSASVHANRPGPQLSASVGVAGSEIPVSADVAGDPPVRVAFRRFASQFCRASRSLALYYSDRIEGSNGDSATRIGSGVRFPSIDRLTDGNKRSLAEKELEVRLRCDYELTYGAGERADPSRPAFEEWRQATLERQYGSMWMHIDLTRIPTPQDPMSRGEWYIYTPPSRE